MIRLGDKVKSRQTAGYGTFTQQAAGKLFEACRGMKLAP